MKGRRQERYSKRRLKLPPQLIEVVESDPDTRKDDECSLQQRLHVRVVVPPAMTFPPNPPDEKPPLPSDLFGIIILGERNAGKTSIVHQFMYRSLINNNKVPASQKRLNFSAVYHKKDLTFWSSSNEVACIRVQLWDIEGFEPSLSEKSCEQLLPMLSKSRVVVLVLSLQHGLPHFLEILKMWKNWLDTLSLSDENICLFIHKCDLLPGHSNGTLDWIQFGTSIANACHQVGIHHYYFTTFKEDSIERAMMGMIRQNISKKSSSTE